MKLKAIMFFAVVSLMVTGITGVPTVTADNVYVKEADNFVFLFDSSNTMNEVDPDTGKKKITLAKKALMEMNQEIPDLGFNAGFYSFTPWDTLVEIGPFDRSRFEKVIDSLPYGEERTHIVQRATPLGSGIRNLGSVLSGLAGRTVVFLFSDGQNTDEFNAAAEAEKLAGKYNVCFLVIGYADNDEPGRQERLQSIANASDCSRMIRFARFIEEPGLCTGALCSVETRVAVRPKDSDGDGVMNENDICPGTPEGFEVNGVGCMLPVIMEERFVHFQFDESFIEKKFYDEIDAFGRFMERHDEAMLVLSGHTDSIGTEKYNQGLSKRRVGSVFDYLMENFNIRKEQVEKHWHGENYPIAKNTTPFGRRENRRVEMLVSGAYKK